MLLLKIKLLGEFDITRWWKPEQARGKVGHENAQSGGGLAPAKIEWIQPAGKPPFLTEHFLALQR
jgi:hypothetical protein